MIIHVHPARVPYPRFIAKTWRERVRGQIKPVWPLDSKPNVKNAIKESEREPILKKTKFLLVLFTMMEGTHLLWANQLNKAASVVTFLPLRYLSVYPKL